MAEPYRWGDVPPPAAMRLRKRREFRGSELFALGKARRGMRYEADVAATALRLASPPPLLGESPPAAPDALAQKHSQ